MRSSSGSNPLKSTLARAETGLDEDRLLKDHTEKYRLLLGTQRRRALLYPGRRGVRIDHRNMLERLPRKLL